LAAAERIAAGQDDVQVAREFRVTKMSANRWRHALTDGGTDALASQGAAGMRCLLTEAQQEKLAQALEQGPAAHGYAEDQRWTLARIRALILALFGVRYRSLGSVSALMARPWWSARPATTTSTTDGSALPPGTDHWRAVCGQSRQHGSGGGRRKRTRTTGTSPAAYLTLNTHKSARMRELVASRDWLTVFQLPAYAPELNPVEGVWSAMKAGLVNLAKRDIDQLQALIKTRLRRMQYRPTLITGLLAKTGLDLRPL